MITIDLTMPIQIVNIIFLIVLMNIVLYRPIRSILAEREKKISGLGRDIEGFKNNGKLRLEEFDSKITEARISAKAKFDGARSTAQVDGADKIAAIRKEVEADKAEKFSQIETQFAAAGAELKGQIEGFAQEMASKVLGRAL
ncbi:MAG: hypothetical protein KKB30_13100 [Proteobacteria bacterium]|nr:hypothetical protein [Pseudomonadota bacterium]MBU1716812.1 hypothetical protein [Pseudomonadota bacterium]